MLRQSVVLAGLAVLLSLLFPLEPLLRGSGIDPRGWHLPAVDLAALCALAALVPAWFLFHDGRLAQRIPPWSARVALLALCSLLFLLLHVSWSVDLLVTTAGAALADGLLPPWISQHVLVDALELMARFGVLLSLVGVLLQLEAGPDRGASAFEPRGSKR